jgi:hypothetical protein
VPGDPAPESTDAARQTSETLARGIARAYRQHIDYRREAALRMWLAFIVMFGFLRGLTFGIRYHVLPVHNVVTSSGLHIHHFVWGILILLVVGFLALVLDQARWHPWLAFAFGAGAALVIDEFALWLNLKDVYWAEQGRSSVDVAILLAALLGLYYAADCFWKQVAREVGYALGFLRREEARIIRCRHT